MGLNQSRRIEVASAESVSMKTITSQSVNEHQRFEKAVAGYKNRLKGGLADDKTPQDFDQEALFKGWKVEKEHTSDDSLAIEIAMDHLIEKENYYNLLEKIENKSDPL
jgi:hypothetical protein